MFAAGEGAILEFLVTLFVQFMGKFIGRAGEWCSKMPGTRLAFSH